MWLYEKKGGGISDNPFRKERTARAPVLKKPVTPLAVLTQIAKTIPSVPQPPLKFTLGQSRSSTSQLFLFILFFLFHFFFLMVFWFFTRGIRALISSLLLWLLLFGSCLSLFEFSLFTWRVGWRCVGSPEVTFWEWKLLLYTAHVIAIRNLNQRTKEAPPER